MFFFFSDHWLNVRIPCRDVFKHILRKIEIIPAIYGKMVWFWRDIRSSTWMRILWTRLPAIVDYLFKLEFIFWSVFFKFFFFFVIWCAMTSPITEIEAFHCDKCPASFLHRYSLTRHRVTHSDIRFECSICKTLFKYKTNLKRHEKNTHGKYIEREQNVFLHIFRTAYHDVQKMCLNNYCLL